MPVTIETTKLIGGPGNGHHISLARPTQELEFIEDRSGQKHRYLRELIVHDGAQYGIWRWESLPIGDAILSWVEQDGSTDILG